MCLLLFEGIFWKYLIKLLGFCKARAIRRAIREFRIIQVNKSPEICTISKINFRIPCYPNKKIP